MTSVIEPQELLTEIHLNFPVWVGTSEKSAIINMFFRFTYLQPPPLCSFTPSPSPFLPGLGAANYLLCKIGRLSNLSVHQFPLENRHKDSIYLVGFL